jgi:hypothetical protein
MPRIRGLATAALGGRAATFAATAAVMLSATLGAARPADAQAAPAPAAASAIRVQAGVAVDRDTVTVGQVFHLTVRVRAPLGATVNFPTAVDSLGPVQALEPPIVRNGADTGAVDRVATYRMAAWNVSRQPIRLGDVLVQAPDGERRVALTLPSVFVRSVLPADSAQRVPKPARPLIAVQAPVSWIWWVVAALVALAIGLGVWMWMRRRRPGEQSTGDPLADAEAGFARVERLRLAEAGEPGRHAALMADVVRRYLAARHPSASLAQTSGELLAAVRGISSVPFERLRALLDDIDPVKFAAAPLARERAHALGEEAKAIVREEHARSSSIAVPAEAAA